MMTMIIIMIMSNRIKNITKTLTHLFPSSVTDRGFFYDICRGYQYGLVSLALFHLVC